MYIGKSINLRNRWNAHEKLVEVESSEGLRLAWQPTPESNLDAVERKMIAALKPKYNYNLVPRPPVMTLTCPAQKSDKVRGMTSERMLTTSEVAARLNVTLRRVRQLIEEGRLPSSAVWA